MISSFETKNYYHDVLIIGSGGSGLAAAILAANKGFNVAVVSKVHPLKSHTVAAQGGINASLGNISPDDWKWHMYDTIKASDWLADEDSVELMCKSAPDAIEMLDEIGVEFDRTESGTIDQKIYGGQSTDFGTGKFAHRACYSKDRTGSSIMEKLYETALKKNVVFYNYNFALDLIKEDQDTISGGSFWDIENGLINIIRANSTIIATGGYSQIYSTATSAGICTGDGNGLVARAGISLQDMEFVQFHPTAICKIGILITEAARSAGAKLINGLGERFMTKYAPKFMELAARDVVSRAIATEILEGRGAGPDKDHVLLDLTHLSQDEIKHNLPTIYENCWKFLDLDPSKQPIPISPASHYTMGGIPTNSNCQVIRFDGEEHPITGLYAIGEAASISVHGAGRLGCNSLLDLIVFAKKVVEELSSEGKQPHPDSSDVIPVKTGIHRSKLLRLDDDVKDAQSTTSIEQLISRLKLTMNINVSVFRSEESLQIAIKDIAEVKEQFNSLQIQDQSPCWNMELQHYLELGNMLFSAESTAKSALWRRESRGSHMRTDFPEKSDDFTVHSIFDPSSGKIFARQVRRVKDNVGFFQPSIRNY